MSKIKILPERLTNKIAAGEVVQRPSSIVKELVENSIDAGATEITGVIRSGGKSLVEVIDNGEGMTKDDLLLAFERYATSKIYKVADLEQINTLGFRGEALASIASVARLTAISTPQDAEMGHELFIEGGAFRKIKPHPPQPGTTISVKNLFFNVPARRKFLKSTAVEFRHIVEVMRKFALINPQLRFNLVHNDKEVLGLRPENLPQRIETLFAPEYKRNLIAVDVEQGDLSLKGVLGNLNLVRARRGEQFFYVNCRFVSDRLMSHAIASGYGALVSRGEYPFYCLNLSLTPAQVDVNVHPTKMEVKFRNQNQIYQFLKHSVEDNIGELTRTAPNLDSFAPRHYYAAHPFSSEGTKTQAKSQDKGVEPEKPTIPQEVEKDKKSQQRIPLHFTRQVDQHKWEQRAKRFTQREPEDAEDETLPEVNVFQLHRKYILSQVKSGLVIIDQHVAHERILYDEALKSMQMDRNNAQQLLFPQVVELSVTDLSVLLEILPYLEKVGFRVKEFGKQTVAVDAVPAGMSWGNEGKVIKDILDHYQDLGTQETDIQSKVAASFACKAAVKAGDVLSKVEMLSLVDRLFATKNPYFCPHGRPIIINLNLEDLDKRFERG